MEIYLVRHGQTTTNFSGTVCGQTDCDLTELGMKQAALLADKLKTIKFDHSYTSPLIRAKKTAEAILPLDKFQVISDLMEMNTGNHSLLTVTDLWINFPLHKFQGRYKYHRYPNGECLNDLYNRIVKWFEIEFHNWNSESRVLIVGHEASVVCLLHKIFQIPLDNYPTFVIKNASYVKVTLDKEANQARMEFL